MTFLPVVERELRVASRRPSTYWGRAVAAFVAIALGVYAFALSREFFWSQLGGVLFVAFAWLAFLYCILAGARHTAACISSERREGTLGLLFLTDLRGYDITLGKLVANSVSALQALLAILPVIAVPLLLGGVAAAQFARVVGVLLATLLYSLALGMFVSMWFESERRAVALATMVLVLLTIGPWIAAALWSSAHQGLPPEFLLLPSPAYAQVLATTGGFPGGSRGQFGLALGLLVVQGIGLLALTGLMLPRLCQDRSASARRERWRVFWRRVGEGSSASRKSFRSKLLTINPFFWLASRGRRGPAYVWTFLGVSVVAWFGLLTVSPGLWDALDMGRYLLLSLFLHGVLRCWIAFAATRRLAEDRRTAALELLLPTPLSVPEILTGQFLALARQFKGPITTVLALDGLLCCAAAGESLVDREINILVYAARGLMLVADAYALAWYGMWRALTTRSVSEATAVSLFRVLALPWVGFLLLVSLFEVVHLDRRWGWEFTDRLALAAWFILGLATDVILGVVAYRNLRARFRLAASEWRKPAWWGRLLGRTGAR